MKWLGLVAVLVAAAAHADGFVVAAHVGPSHLDPCAGCEDTPLPAWGAAGGIEAGYSFGFAGTTLGPLAMRAGLALDVAHANTTVFDLVGGATDIHYTFASLEAKLTVDVVRDLVFVWGGLGETVETHRRDSRGTYYELGIGCRLWVDGHDAVRFDARYGRATLDYDPLEIYGIDIGFEHYF